MGDEGGPPRKDLNDVRADFMGTYVCKSMRLKPEKWNKMISTDEFRVIVADYLNDDAIKTLVISTNNAGALVPTYDFSPTAKGKVLYFVRKKPGLLPKDNIRDALSFGSISSKPINDLSVLVDEVFVSVLTNPLNSDGWPDVVIKDIDNQLQNLRNNIAEVRGNINNNTILPLPITIGKVMADAADILGGNLEACTIKVRFSLEEIVIKWANTIEEVIGDNSYRIFQDIASPMPGHEVTFWQGRLKNLKNIFDQLRDPRIKTIASILEKLESVYFSTYRVSFRNVVESLHEARDVTLFLTPLAQFCETFQMTDFEESRPQLKSLMNAVCLLWGNSKYYCINNRMVHMFRLMHNLFIDQVRTSFDPSSAFQCEAVEALNNVEQILESLEYYKTIHQKFRDSLPEFINHETGNDPPVWSFEPSSIYGEFDRFIGRLTDLRNIFDTANEFSKLERVEIGGIKGRQINRALGQIAEDFAMLYREWTNVCSKYDVLDVSPQLPHFDVAKANFDEKAGEMERKLATQFDLAFEQCYTTAQCSTLIQILGTIMHRPIVMAELKQRYDDVIETFARELEMVKRTFDRGVRNVETMGVFALPIDQGQAPVTGVLKWINKLRQRLLMPASNFPYLDYDVFDNDRGRYVMTQNNHMLQLLDDYQKVTLSKWSDEVSKRIPDLLKMNLVARADPIMLNENFHNDMEAALRETRTNKVMEISNIPDIALKLSDREDELYLLKVKLSRIVEWYNSVSEKTVTCESNMLAKEKSMLDTKLDPLIRTMTWEKYNAGYVDEVYILTKDYYDRVMKAQANISKILASIESWGNVPLFPRKDFVNEALLDILTRDAALESRLKKCLQSKRLIDRIMLDENFRLFFNLPFSCPCSSGSDDSEEEDEDEPQIMNSDGFVVAKQTAASAEDVGKLREPYMTKVVIDGWQGELYRPYLEYVDGLISKAIMDGVATSIKYIKDEMDNRFEHDAPIFEVKYELQNQLAVFIPNMDTLSPNGFMALVDELIVDIYSMCDMIPRVAQPPVEDRRVLEEDAEPGDTAADIYVATYESVLRENTHIEHMRDDIVRQTKKTLAKSTSYVTKYNIYEYLWTTDRDVLLQQFLKYGRGLSDEEVRQMADSEEFKVKEVKPTLDMFREQMAKYHRLGLEVQKLEEYTDIDVWMRIRVKGFKFSLLNELTSWGLLFKYYLRDQVLDSLQELEEFCDDAFKVMGANLDKDDLKALLRVINVLNRIEERSLETDRMFDPLKDIAAMLKEYKFEFDAKIYTQFADLPDMWNKVKKVALNMKQVVAPIQAYQVDLIGKRVMLFEARTKLYRTHFRNQTFFGTSCPDVYTMLDKTHLDLCEMEETGEGLKTSTQLFDLPAPDSSSLVKCRKEIKLLKELWDFVFMVRSRIEDWKETPWNKIDVEEIDQECKKIGKDMRLLDKDLRSWDPFLHTENTLKNLMTSLRAITELQNPAIRDRHWSELIDTTHVKIEINEDTTLANLVNLNLHNFEEDIKNIVDKSVKEGAMEKVLREMEIIWKDMSFEYEQHMRTGKMLLKTTEETLEVLEDHQGQLQNMLSSKYIPHFLAEVSSWQEKLGNADAVISAWTEVQRKWQYLESIFIGSKDIRSQLPEDSKRFDTIDADFKELLATVDNESNIVAVCNRPGLLPKLEQLQDMLTMCEKALNDYLETKRLAFPRFYFISSSDLLDILSNGNQPDLVCRHLTKLYDSLANMTLSGTTASEMISKEKEIIPFKNKCDCSGQVENWLNRVTESMKTTLHASFAASTVSYEEHPRDKWIFKFPAQPALCTTQIWWTNETNTAFASLEEGYENALKDYQRKQISQLNALIVLLLGNLSQNDRQKIMTVCTIDVHSRDVVAKMIAQRVDNSLAFQWQCQLRHRWDKRANDCFANICDAQFRYDFEYLGNTPRLVITPLTDRCYITLTQSLHLVMGGAPAGPAGTGKTETTKDLGKGLGVMVYVFNCSEQMDYKSCGNIYKGLAQTGAWGCFDEFNRIAVEVLSVVAVQVKSILDAIKMRRTMFNFMGEIIRLIPTVGMFITMNPGYAGRTELPENLKALFRPCAMCVPDFALISEIMLVAEGFQDARQLSRKFITLYTLCKELLSKQDHYDWGLRAIKSVLVVAGALKRSDRDRPEDQVLMRALRDFNVPKIVTEDAPIFMGLIGDLFPNLDVPRKQDLDFEKVIKKSTLDLKLQTEPAFILKVVQLEELFAVRHSVFVVGFAGTGKSEVWKTLNRTYFNQKRKPFYNDLNPKAVTNDELFGIINPATREWKDGLFSVIMRDQANMGGDGPKWIVLDGDIDPMWIESLNTLMDDNKILTLASNERIALTKEMRLLFEIGGLKTATPATVSRAGILYINPQDLGWQPFVTSWRETRSAQESSVLNVLFDKYVPPLLEIMKSKLKKITPISEIAMLQMTCHLLDCLYTPQNLPNDCPKEWFEIYFVFAAIWGFGSSLFQDQIIDWRNEFNKWWLNEFKTVKFPSTGGTVFNFYIDPETKAFMPWTKLVPSYELDPDIPLQSALVNTAETTRLRYFMDILIEKKHPVMLVGGSGSGKSVIVSDKLNALSLTYAITNVPFNFYTTSMVLQNVLEKPLEKKAGRVYGPPGNKRMIYFIDDMNMPEVDTYGTVQPHTLVRQFMDYQHWYDRAKLSLKDISNCQFISCMNPTAGSFTIDTRLQRHFATFAVSFPGADAMFHIYHSILSQHVANPLNKFHPKMGEICEPLIATAIVLHQKMNTMFLPTAVKFHYNFNMRDLANVFSGMMFANGDCCPNKNMLVRLYVHEAYRVYGDKLVTFDDLDVFNKLIVDTVRKGTETVEEAAVFEKPLVYFHYAEGLNDAKYMPCRSLKQLQQTLTEAQSSYSDVIGAMNLVLFEDAMSHICRISRILENDRGYALLIGVGGSGKQSLTRLAAYISGLDVFQTQLRKGFSATDLRLDLAALYMKAGVKNAMCCYLMTDSQVAEEQFLVLINDMLASGEIVDLFAPDEIENIVNAVRNETKQAGIVDTKENCWSFFINKVRRQLKVVLCFSPVGSTLRVRGRKFPALVNCTAIDWFHEWPQTALESVSTRFLAEIPVLPEELIISVSQFMAYVHGTVNSMSQVYLQNERRYNYTTPKSFLELIALYSKLLSEKHAELSDRIVRLETGLIKLADCSAQVDGLQEQLKVQEVILNVKKGEADKQHAIVSAENEKVGKEKTIAAACVRPLANSDGTWMVFRLPQRGTYFTKLHHVMLHERGDIQIANASRGGRPKKNTIHTGQPPAIPSGQLGDQQQCQNEKENHAHAQQAHVYTCQEAPAENSLLFRVLPVVLRANGRELNTYALLDEGSCVTLVDESVADELGLDGPTEDLSMMWFGKQKTVMRSRKLTLGISGPLANDKRYKMNVRTITDLSLPTQTVNPAVLLKTNPHLRDVPLAAYRNAVPRILIGLDNHHLGVPREVKTDVDEEGLVAVRTKLGWVAYGSDGPTNLPNAMVFLVDGERNEEYELLNEVVRTFIMSDNLGIVQPRAAIESDEVIRARSILMATTKRVGERFETGLLWRLDEVELPDSYSMALRRLNSIEAKMRRDSNYAAQYVAQMDGYLAKGYARKLSIAEAQHHDGRTWYLPHFAVQNPNKPGKFRMVFDAAAKVQGVSLNSALLTGPDENMPLARLLFQFRMGEVGVCADIREMFHQVRIRSEDQNAQRFLWRGGDSNAPPDVYVMTVMTFGAACSPASAQHVKNFNAAEHEAEHPEAADAIRRRHYVDDYVASFATVDEAVRITADVVKVHLRGGFDLRGIVSNSSVVLEALGVSTGPEKTVDLEPEATFEKILGMTWNTVDDTFRFRTRFARVQPDVLNGTIRPTKRAILSTSMSVFDPYGLLANFMLPAKLMVQDLYRMGMDWDEPAPDEICERCDAWRSEIEGTKLLCVPRCGIRDISSVTDLQLHVFADASEAAFAAVAFWRITRADQVELSFVAGKVKVAPTPIQSVPRLELNAAVMATRLLDEIRRSHVGLQINKVVMWSDSETVLNWIRSDQRKYKQFVGFRVAEIAESTVTANWRWVPTSQNVADDGTRVNTPPRFDPNGRWLWGPAWLREDEETWTKQREVSNAKEPYPEELRTKFVGIAVSQTTINYERFSSFYRICRTVAWILRFRTNTLCKKNGYQRTTGELTALEVDAGMIHLCRMVQKEKYNLEYAALQRGHMIEQSSKIFMLKPYLDDSNLVRIHGRTDAAADKYLTPDARRPILLPRDHRFTMLMVRAHHEQMAHQLTEATIASVRQRFWVPNIRTLVQNVRINCQTCKNRSALPKPPVMGQLPRDRLTPYVRPFNSTGIDYFGPITVKIGRRFEKRWVALFTCLAVRAVHLEIATNLSTDACLVCIRNLCNLRGVPGLIRCDNGTNFVGARNRLNKETGFFDPEAVRQELTTRGVEWKFNCPANPEAGGAWERLVQSVKRVLAITLMETTPEVETLRAHLLEAANIINSRPLTHIPVDPNEAEPITPNHFLLGGPNMSTIPEPGDVRSLCSREQWIRCREMSRMFWKQWIRDYLPELTRRSKHYPERTPLRIGDLVIVCDSGQPRSHWARGRVVNTKIGGDGEIRTAKVQTSDGEYWRPVSKLAVLDVSLPQE